MSTSGSWDFSLTAAEIIQEALEHLDVALPGESVNYDMQASMLRSLNMMVKAWQAEGIGLWLNQKITVFLPSAAQSILLGPSGGNATAVSGMVAAQLTADAASGATTIYLDTITGLADSMYIGIQLDAGTMQWTTVSGTPSSLSVTLADALTSAASTGNVVYAYTSKIQRPKSIVDLRRVDYTTGIEIPLFPASRDEYMSLPLKSTVGPPNMYYYDPQLINGALYIWPTVDTVQTRLTGTVRTPVSDFDIGADDADFPPEWLEALAYNLALRGGTKFVIPDELWKRILYMADLTKTELEGFDTEDTSTYMTVAVRY